MSRGCCAAALCAAADHELVPKPELGPAPRAPVLLLRLAGNDDDVHALLVAAVCLNDFAASERDDVLQLLHLIARPSLLLQPRLEGDAHALERPLGEAPPAVLRLVQQPAGLRALLQPALRQHPEVHDAGGQRLACRLHLLPHHEVRHRGRADDRPVVRAPAQSRHAAPQLVLVHHAGVSHHQLAGWRCGRGRRNSNDGSCGGGRRLASALLVLCCCCCCRLLRCASVELLEGEVLLLLDCRRARTRLLRLHGLLTPDCSPPPPECGRRCSARQSCVCLRLLDHGPAAVVAVAVAVGSARRCSRRPDGQLGCCCSRRLLLLDEMQRRRPPGGCARRKERGAAAAVDRDERSRCGARLRPTAAKCEAVVVQQLQPHLQLGLLRHQRHSSNTGRSAGRVSSRQ